MKKLKAAIIYHSCSIRASERQAAFSGLREFEKFGVECELIDVSNESVRKVKRGFVLKDAIYSRELSIHPFDLFHSSAREFLSGLFIEVDVRGIALTESVLFSTEGQMRSRSLGLSAHGIGGIVSVSRLREICYSAQAMRAIRLAVMHEMGHVLGRKDHCSNDGCLMQENRNHMDFVERFVEMDRKICMDCSGIIASTVPRLTSDL